MADLVSFDTLVENLEDGLNTLATSLAGSSKIDRDIQCVIVPHYQDNEENKEWANSRIAGIATRATGDFAPSQTYQRYSDTIFVTFDIHTRDSEDVDYLLNEYANQNSGLLVKTSDWVYWGTFQRPTFLGRDTDSGHQHINVVWEITYNFVYRGVIADDITVKINTVEVPVLSYAAKVTKEGPTTKTKNTSGKSKSLFTESTVSKTIKFIHVSNAQLTNLLSDIDKGDNLNRAYSIEYTIDGGYTNTDTYVMSNGSIEFVEGQFQTIEATFLLYLDV